MQLQESGEMYLETILILSETSDSVRSVDVGKYLGFSKPSVSRAVGLLRQGGFLIMRADGSLVLTAEGHEIADKIYARHKMLTSFLVSLGVDAETAAEDACKMEHDISDQSFRAILRLAEQL